MAIETFTTPAAAMPGDDDDGDSQASASSSASAMTETPQVDATHVDVVLAAPADWPADPGELERTVRRAAKAVLAHEAAATFRHVPTVAAVTVTLADNEEVRRLNRRWRGRDGPTNVLSFPAPADMPVPPEEPVPLGDLVLAGPVVVEEARRAGVSLADHLAWLVVHGMLHLLGYDHVEPAERERMEALERRILAALAVADPYE